MNIEQAQKDVENVKTNLESIRLDLVKKRAEYNAAEESHVQHVAKTAGRQRYPRSLQVQRESLLRLRLEIEALEKAEKIAEEELEEAKNTLHLAELYQNVVKPYQQAERAYFEKANEVIAAVDELNKMTVAVCGLVDKFLEQSGNPVGILRSLVNDPALSGLSLEKFLGGEITKEIPGENDAFLDSIAIKYGQIAQRLPEVKTTQNSIESLSDHFYSINTDANSLVPRHVKYIPAHVAPKGMENDVQKGRLLPRHATGGPDVDEKDNPHSDYWFHRRRALLQAKDATTVLGKAKT